MAQPSIAERLAAARATKAEAAQADQERVSTDTRDVFAAKLGKREDIARLRKAVTETAQEVAAARTGVRGERQNLRNLHQEAQELGEAIPSPIELTKDEKYRDEASEELQDTPEVQAYRAKGEAFSEAAGKAKQVYEEIAALGIEDPEKLSLEELDGKLDTKAQEVTTEAIEILNSNPDLDAEGAAELKEAVINEKAEKIYRSNKPTEIQIMFGDIVRPGPEREGTPSIERGVEAALARSGMDEAFFYEGMRQAFGNDPVKIGELDVDALSLAAARQMIKGYRLDSGTVKGLGEIYGVDVEQEGNWDVVVERAITDIAANPQMKEWARTFVEDYKAPIEYNKLREEMRSVNGELRKVEDRLSIVDRELQVIPQRIAYEEKNAQAALESSEKYLRFNSTQKPELEAKYAPILDAEVDNSLGLVLKGAFPQLKALETQDTNLRQNEDITLSRLRTELTALENKKTNFLYSEAKKQAEITSKREQIESIESPRATRQAAIDELKARIDLIKGIRQELKDYDDWAVVREFKGGTLRDYLAVIASASLSGATLSRQTSETGSAQVHALRQQEMELTTEREGLAAKKQGLETRVGEIEARQEEIRSIDKPRVKDKIRY